MNSILGSISSLYLNLVCIKHLSTYSESEKENIILVPVSWLFLTFRAMTTSISNLSLGKWLSKWVNKSQFATTAQLKTETEEEPDFWDHHCH
jgi:hypothetical protein